MSMCPLFNPACRRREDPPGMPRAVSRGWQSGGRIAGGRALGMTGGGLAAVALMVGIVTLSIPAWAQTADDLAEQYKIENMEQALQTKERFDLYGLRFESDQSTIPAGAKPLLDDIAPTLKNFPEWHLRI